MIAGLFAELVIRQHSPAQAYPVVVDTNRTMRLPLKSESDGGSPTEQAAPTSFSESQRILVSA